MKTLENQTNGKQSNSKTTMKNQAKKPKQKNSK